MIYESPDEGKTIYARQPGSSTRRLIKQNVGINYATFIDILRTAEHVPALQSALDNVILIYNLSKDND